MPTPHRIGAAVYFSACINRMFGNSEGTESQQTIAEAMATVSERAGLPLWIPDDLAGNRCATALAFEGL